MVLYSSHNYTPTLLKKHHTPRIPVQYLTEKAKTLNLSYHGIIAIQPCGINAIYKIHVYYIHMHARIRKEYMYE